MIDSKIGYMICETAASEPQTPIIVSEKNNRPIIEARLQDMEVKNRNGRYYSKSELAPELTSSRITELVEAKSFFGEMGHPMSKDIGRQQTIEPTNIAHNMLKLWIDGNDIMAHVQASPTQTGQDFNNLILDGTKVAFSLRALGSVENTKRGAEVRNIKVITWDAVIYPSHRRAYLTKTGVLGESATGIVDNFGNPISSQNESSNLILQENDKGLLTPITNQSVMSYIKSESCNIKNILESFDTLYDTATVIENASKVQLTTKDGDIFVINLESYIQNEIMDYAYKY